MPKQSKPTKKQSAAKKQPTTKKQSVKLDPEADQKLFGEISDTIQQAKIKQDLQPIFAEALHYMEQNLENKGYGKCEVKILVNLPKAGWLQGRNR